MVAADVDNDLFRSGENVQHGDGEGLANLSYRITALYTGRDNVLGASAGLKHDLPVAQAIRQGQNQSRPEHITGAQASRSA